MDQRNAPYDAIAQWYDASVGGAVYDELLLPGLLDLSGNVHGKLILDLACGQGWVARKLARRGALVTGIDLSRRLLDIAAEYETLEPLGIRYVYDDAQTLKNVDECAFDGVICNLAVMDIPDVHATFHAAHRILQENGWFIFSLTHPCYEVPRGRWMIREDGAQARDVTGYFEEGFWRSDNPHGVRGQVGAYHRMLSTYLNALAEAGFCLERMHEPRATGCRAEQVPGNREVPSFILIRARADVTPGSKMVC